MPRRIPNGAAKARAVRFSLSLIALVALAAIGSLTARADGPTDSLCGVLSPVDQVLRCSQPSASTPTETAPPGGSNEQGRGEPPSAQGAPATSSPVRVDQGVTARAALATTPPRAGSTPAAIRPGSAPRPVRPGNVARAHRASVARRRCASRGARSASRRARRARPPIQTRPHGTAGDAAIGIVKAADRGASVINLSFGGPVGTQTLLDAIKYALGKGAVVVAAAGNDGLTKPTFPAAYPGVIGVGAVNPAQRAYPWSNRGTWVWVTAPGCNVAPRAAGGYAEFCGTSSAAPLVSGLAALARSARPRAGPAQIVAAIARARGRGGMIDANRMFAALGIRT